MIDADKIDKEIKEIKQHRSNWLKGNEYMNYTADEFSDAMKNKYEYLYKNSATLFKKCIDGEADNTRVNEMIDMLKQMQNGRTLFDASKEIGTKLTNYYVKPLIEKKI